MKPLNQNKMNIKEKDELIEELMGQGLSKNEAIELVDGGYSDIKYDLSPTLSPPIATVKESLRKGAGQYSPNYNDFKSK